MLYYRESNSGKSPWFKMPILIRKPEVATFRTGSPPNLAAQPLCVFFPSFILLNPSARTLSSKLLLGNYSFILIPSYWFLRIDFCKLIPLCWLLYIGSFILIPLYWLLHTDSLILIPLYWFLYIGSFIFLPLCWLAYGFLDVNSFILIPLYCFLHIDCFILLPLYCFFYIDSLI